MALLNLFNRLIPLNLTKPFQLNALQARYKSKKKPKKPCKPRRDLVPRSLDEKDQYIWKMRETTIMADEPMDVTLVSGAAVEAQNEILAKIYTPAKNPMQSGTSNTGHWIVSLEGGQRWQNPNMGWTSNGNPVSNVRLNFSTKEDAIAFCEKTGWCWIVLPSSTKKKFKVKSYAENFSYDKRYRVGTK